MSKKIIIIICAALISTMHGGYELLRTKIQKEFMRLQQSVGLNNPPKKAEQIEGPRKGKTTRRQAQLDDARKDLNELLQQSSFNVAKVQSKIARFEDLKPKHWPQPQDYREVLAAKMNRMAAAQNI